MASQDISAFSPDGQYWAICSNDGKLKIWETSTSRLKQEFVPNLHLSSPCSVLTWMTVGQQAPQTTTSPWKKKKRKSISEDTEQKQIIAMGSVTGKLTLYDVSTASVCKVLTEGHTSSITAISWSKLSGLFTAGDDHQIVNWNTQENNIKCKWKSGKGKVTALEALQDGKSILSAERTIKWWSLETKAIIGTFTGHANQITLLKSIIIDDNTRYLISGATGDTYLGVWSLNNAKKGKTSTANLTLQDDPVSLSVQSYDNSQISILSANRSGQVNLFVYQPNGQCVKPLKPNLTIIIASDTTQQQNDTSTMELIPIKSGCLTDDKKLLISYGQLIDLTFEKIIPDFTDKIQSLVRTDGKRIKEKKHEAIVKVKAADSESNVEYIVPGSGATIKKIKNSIGSQLPLKNRLENLSLNTDINIAGKTPTKGYNKAKLLIEGLKSKDKNILMTVLNDRDESIVKSTIGSLPVQAIAPLLKELTVMLQGKTYPSRIATTWLKALVLSHAGQLLSQPDISDIVSPILGIIDGKLSILPELSRLRGRVALVTGQISHLKDNDNKDMMDESLLDFKDTATSDEEDSDVGEFETGSCSDQTWLSNDDSDDQEDLMENGKSDDDEDDDDGRNENEENDDESMHSD